MISWTKNRNLQAAKNSAGKEEGDIGKGLPHRAEKRYAAVQGHCTKKRQEVSFDLALIQLW